MIGTITASLQQFARWLMPQQTAAPTTQEQQSRPASDPLNPRIFQDVQAGVLVTEFRDGNNNIQAQYPPRTVLAYLRAGLGVDGMPDKKSNEVEDVMQKPNATIDRTI